MPATYAFPNAHAPQPRAPRQSQLPTPTPSRAGVSTRAHAPLAAHPAPGPGARRRWLPRGLWIGSRAGTAALALLGLVALLFAFMHVVQASVALGESRRRVAAEDAVATWRCQALRGARERDACMAPLRAAQAVR